ncbi:hypothetical protein ILUMI_22642 [Ignelater luminosus]|uniref:Sugar transporter SWEET n=1 Tax=Ignelater luminosus TaxID=2038154 RepID=A0A8K0CE20_IGNLU|nr:hypothetical protein ILUMI_22642 [Ignelater luminosus]
MEALSKSLQPYKGLIGSVASVVTIAQFFSGGVICNDIYKRKTTAGVSAMPFVGGLVIGILMLKYSQMLQDGAMLAVNVAAVILNVLYTAFYYAYSQDKSSEIHKPLTYGFTLIALLLGYVSWEDPTLVEYRFGFIVTVLMLLLMGSPLIELNEIIAKKDASSIPFPITFSAFIVTFLWLLYGIILLNDFMIIQNVLGLLLCAAQLVLYWMYPKKLTAVKQD